MQESLKKLILKLFDIGAIEFGAFRFKHHEKHPDAPLAPMKINLRTPNHPADPGKLTPDVVFAIAVQFLEIIDRENIRFDYVCGIPKAGEPFAEVVAKILNKPLIRAEKTETFGKRKINRLFLPYAVKPGQSVAIFDDVITKGESKREIIQIFKKAVLEIAALIVFADRQEGGMKTYTNLGYRIIAATTVTNILDVGLAGKKISQRRYQECLDYLELSGNL